MSNSILSIDIGGTKTIVALCSRDGQVIDPQRAGRPADKDAFWIRESLFERIDRLREIQPEKFSLIKSCGIGFGGPVQNNRPVLSMHVPGWEEIDLCREITDRYGIPACMENDCVTQALGEHAFGAGKGRASMTFGNLGTGFGGGVILDNRAVAGDGGFAGHLGHICVVPGGRLCPCGNYGCLEAYCSGTSIGKRACEAVEIHGEIADPLADAISKLGPDEGAGPVLFDFAKKGDPLALELVEETLDYLAQALSATVNILDIRLIVLGGGAGIGLSPWFDQLQKRIAGHSMPLCREGLEVKVAELGEHSLLLGTVPLCQERLGS
ncbi:MAG: ROK family protein [Candidatus Omnitrophica bacterium]|nr:ROK family protein [Candidatus Omnitrophota bacterium]